MAKQAAKTGKKGAVSMDVADFLINNATQGTAKSREAADRQMPGHEKLADRVSKAYRGMKDAEAEFRLVEGELLGLTDAEYEKRSRQGDHTKSLDLPGSETAGVQVTYQDKFSALDIAQEPALKGALGDKYDTYFEQSRKLTLREEATDNETIKMLVEKLGQETFKRIFDIKVSVVCKGDMDRKQFELPEGLGVLAGLKQAKASVKLRKGE